MKCFLALPTLDIANDDGCLIGVNIGRAFHRSRERTFGVWFESGHRQGLIELEADIFYTMASLAEDPLRAYLSNARV